MVLSIKTCFVQFSWKILLFIKVSQRKNCQHFIPDETGYRVKRPPLARVPSLARFFNNLTEVTCVKEQVVKFFFTEAVNTIVRCGAVGLMCTVTILLKKNSLRHDYKKLAIPYQ